MRTLPLSLVLLLAIVSVAGNAHADAASAKAAQVEARAKQVTALSKARTRAQKEQWRQSRALIERHAKGTVGRALKATGDRIVLGSGLAKTVAGSTYLGEYEVMTKHTLVLGPRGLELHDREKLDRPLPYRPVLSRWGAVRSLLKAFVRPEPTQQLDREHWGEALSPTAVQRAIDAWAKKPVR